MKPEFEAYLCKKYSKIFRLKAHDIVGGYDYFGFECGDGWLVLLDTLCGEIQRHVDANNLLQVEARQVKEKYGGLRFYYTGGDDIIHELVKLAEDLSNITCDICGGAASSEVIQGWVVTRCNLHR
ncbi:hypothetical protein DJ564_17865 [Pseudomonas sp. 31-12]|uniref:hypothetical protein n=1 Tax=Pseudomonas sp. 31-12 TaxID=2201356 RepID=UPI000D6B305C|nr:hypothetical protein [Pseudomonas sp. 31-12]AWM92544.1 hypothetical protein DJ564_17865 [Pseudomonas sp. 31-12]